MHQGLKKLVSVAPPMGHSEFGIKLKLMAYILRICLLLFM